MNYIDIFKEICKISRPSHKEKDIADYLCDFAERHNLNYRRDDKNCVVIEKVASVGYEDHEPVVILNHMDMVCVADAGYNAPGPVTPIIYNDHRGEQWMKANHTSLGADNGIGLSMALAILADDSLQHPALEVLTTTCEEDDMSGAANLSADFIKGRKVISLDSEAYDELTVASAGAKIQVAHLPYQCISKPEDYIAYTVSVTGGRGGHSGVDINEGRANAIKVLANLLLVAIRQVNIKLYLVNFTGGSAYSAIPDEAEAKVVIPKENIDEFETVVSQCNDAVKAQFFVTDPGVIVECEQTVWHSSVINEEGTHLLLACINGIPTGPVEKDDNDRVITSNNIGVVNMGKKQFMISTHTRSFDEVKLEDLASNMSRIFTLTGATVDEIMHVYPWNADTAHPLIKQTMETFQNVLGFKPKTVSMHFALEAGFLVKKFPNLHMASFGPRIIHPHSTDEHVSITSADNIWRVVIALLAKL